MKILKTVQTKRGNNIELVTVDEILSNRKALIIGVFHGDEPQGKYLIDKYLANSSKSGICKRSKLFIPCLNPDGMALGTRTNASGVDLNRNFPTKNWGEDTSAAGKNPENYYGGVAPMSEIETKFVVEIIEEYNPELILTLHAPYKIVNYDGPAAGVAEKISKIIGYPVEPGIGYPTPGSFGTYCGVERKIPTITLELDEEIPVNDLIKPIFEVFDTI